METENTNQDLGENENVETPNKSYYRPSVKKAIMNYRAKNIVKYNEFQRQYYHTKKRTKNGKLILMNAVKKQTESIVKESV